MFFNVQQPNTFLISTKKMILTSDNVLECVFSVSAKDEDEFDVYRQIIGQYSHFCCSFDERYEEDEDGGVWKVIDTTTQYTSINELKEDIEKLRSFDWFNESETIYLHNGDAAPIALISDGSTIILDALIN